MGRWDGKDSRIEGVMELLYASHVTLNVTKINQ